MGRYYNGDIEGKFWFAVQDSDAADRFGVIGLQPEEQTEELYYYFDEDSLPGIYQELTYIENKLGNKLAKLNKFFEENNSYTDEKLAKYINVGPNVIQSILKEYADYVLGLKIMKAIQTTGQCEFTAEI